MEKSKRFVKIINETWKLIQETPEDILTKQSKFGNMRDVWKILYAIWRQRKKMAQ